MQIAVIGASRATEEDRDRATQVGRALAEAGATLLTGGGDGVMRAAFEGARDAGGRTVAVRPDLPSAEDTAVGYDVRLYTGMGQARNVVLVLSADAVVAIGGEWGTLSEIALARKHGTPVVGLGSWHLEPPEEAALDTEIPSAQSADEAARLAIELASARRSQTP